jgi:hypothetical protein
MKLTLDRPSYAVFDDVLPARQFQLVQAYFSHQAKLSFINTVEHLDVWSIDDGHPLASPVVLAEVQAQKNRLATRPLVRGGDGPFFSHPTDSALDLVFDKLLAMSKDLTKWTGVAGRDWRTLTGRAFVYPQNTSLDWHDDGGQYRAAFSYYTHAEWQPRWGGELLVITDGATKRRQSMTGEFVLPMPNRLVVLTGGVPHKVARVTTSAGANHRRAVSGFYAKATAEQVSEGTLAHAVELSSL